jgi:hypothetical protein
MLRPRASLVFLSVEGESQCHAEFEEARCGSPLPTRSRSCSLIGGGMRNISPENLRVKSGEKGGLEGGRAASSAPLYPLL